LKLVVIDLNSFLKASKFKQFENFLFFNWMSFEVHML
jgi:hypothetical protein